MDINADLELEMKISRRELRVLPLHEFHLGQQTIEAQVTHRHKFSWKFSKSKILIPFKL